jgi:hypothetical protein
MGWTIQQNSVKRKALKNNERIEEECSKSRIINFESTPPK